MPDLNDFTEKRFVDFYTATVFKLYLLTMYTLPFVHFWPNLWVYWDYISWILLLKLPMISTDLVFMQAFILLIFFKRETRVFFPSIPCIWSSMASAFSELLTFVIRRMRRPLLVLLCLTALYPALSSHMKHIQKFWWKRGESKKWNLNDWIKLLHSYSGNETWMEKCD